MKGMIVLINVYISNQIPQETRADLPTTDTTYYTSSNISEELLDTVEIAWGLDKNVISMIESPGSKLKWIQSFSAGVDYFPIQQIRERNIILTNTSGIHATAIANTVLLYALFFTRNLKHAIKSQSNQEWDSVPHFDKLQTLRGKRWLIFGTGHIGREIARLAKATDGETIGVNTTGHPADNFDLTVSITEYSDYLKNVDIILNILPLTTETRHLFNDEFFNKLEKLYLFINVGRGPSVDEKALELALDSGTVQNAALDVFETEPLSPSSPLWNYDQVLITPHESAESNELLPAVHDVFVNNLDAYLSDGVPDNDIVNTKEGY